MWAIVCKSVLKETVATGEDWAVRTYEVAQMEEQLDAFSLIYRSFGSF